jgi:hypothetical protein
MPMIDLTFVRGSIDEETLGRLSDELATVLLRAERAPDTAFCATTPGCTYTPWVPPSCR